jgi:ribosomal protein L11 methyltransferase
MSEPSSGTASAPCWRIEVQVPAAAAAAFESDLSDLGYASSIFNGARPGALAVQILSRRAPDAAAVVTRIAAAARALGVAAPLPAIAKLPARDWVTHTNRLLHPIQAARFYLYGGHDAATVPPNAWAIRLEAGRAFGTGRAPSTFGCLLAINDLARRRRVRSALDLGTGSGVLAMALALATTARVVAADIDPVAVDVAQANIALNGLRPRVRAVCADGLRHRVIAAAKPFDLIVANILAAPLARLAPALAAHLAPGGAVVLSGLLSAEQPVVLARYRGLGFRLERRIMVEDWATLILRRGGART